MGADFDHKVSRHARAANHPTHLNVTSMGWVIGDANNKDPFIVL